MDWGEIFVYVSVWVALVCYPAAAVGRATSSPDVEQRARAVWTLGCVIFWLHVVSAYGVFYQWSHDVALTETARQTLAATGFESGSGLYLNYVFALLWSLETVWWWRRPCGYVTRPLSLFLGVHGFFLFMIVNGAVVFVDGPRRWLGLVIVMAGAAAVAWAVRASRRLAS